MAKRSHEALKARDRGAAATRHTDAPPYAGDLARPPKPARVYWLRRMHAHLELPTPRRPYCTVRSSHGVFLGAGRDPERAVWNAMARTRALLHPATTGPKP